MLAGTRRISRVGIALCGLLLALAAVAPGARADVYDPADWAPSVWSDKADYAPGELVTLSGAHWQPGEVVNVVVNDDAGQTWRRDVDVTADDAGGVTDAFNLPEHFVAEYKVTASGRSSGAVATTSFTDGNVKVFTSGVPSAQIGRTLYNGSGCSGTVKSNGNLAADTGGKTVPGGVGSSESLKLVAPDVTGVVFTGWTQPPANTPQLAFSTVAGDIHAICIAGFGTGGSDITANYRANTLPTATVGLSTTSPTTNQTLTATATKDDANGDPVSLTFVWTVGGVVRRTFTSATALTDSFDLSQTDNGDKGQSVTVEVTPNDGFVDGATATGTATVVNSAPTATVSLETSSPRTNDTLTATATKADADGDAVSLTYVWKVNGLIMKTTSGWNSLTDAFDLSQAGNGDKGQTVTVEVTPSDGDDDGDTATDQVVVDNTPPAATVDLDPQHPKTNGVLTATATTADADGDAVTLTYVWNVNGGEQKTTTGSSDLTDTFDLSVAGHGGKGDDVTVEVIPNDGGEDGVADSDAVTIVNTAPELTSATATPHTVDEGSPVELDGSAIDDDLPGETLAFDWAFGDGGHSGYGASAATTHSYDDGPADPSAALTVRDGDSATDTSDAIAIHVNNVPPKATFETPASVDEGSRIALALTDPSDPSSADTAAGFAYAFDCGSGYGAYSSDNTSGCPTTDNGTRVVKGRIRDKDGGEREYTASVDVQNVAPKVNLTGPNSADEGETKDYSFTVTDAGSGDTWEPMTDHPTCGDEGTVVTGSVHTDGDGGSFSCFFADGPTTTNVAVKVVDDDGAQSVADVEHVEIIPVVVANVPPVVVAPDDQTSDEGEDTQFDLGSFGDPGPDGPWMVDVDWGDGSAHTTYTADGTGELADREHVYADGPATHTVKVQVTDKDGGIGTTTFDVKVANVAPTVVLTGDDHVDEGETRTYSYTVTDPGVHDTFTVDAGYPDCDHGDTDNGVLVGDPEVTAAGGSFKCKFPDGDSVANVKIKVTDSDSGSSSDSESVQVVNVANVAPVLTTPADQSSAEGEDKSFDLGSFTDPGPDAPWQVSVDWGDGSAPTTFTADDKGALAPQHHTYADGTRTYHVTVTVTDENGGHGSAVFDVHVDNVAPKVNLVGATNVDEGDVVLYTYTVSDPGELDTFTVDAGFPDCDAAISNNGVVDGTPETTAHGGSFYCRFPDGSRQANVKIKVTDSDGAGTTDSESVTIVEIANVVPTLTKPADQSAGEGVSQLLELGSFTDPGADADWHVTVSWGDGSSDSTFTTSTAGTISAKSHTYADDGSYELKVAVDDGDGGIGSATFAVTVQNAAPVVTAPSDDTADEGTGKSFGLGSFADAGVNDGPWSVSVDWGDGSPVHSFQSTTQGALGPAPHAYADNGTYSMTVTVTDQDGGIDSRTSKIDVMNVAPTAALGDDGPVNEGESFQISLSNVDDVSPVDRAADFEYAFDCGSGFGSFSTTSSRSCPPTDDNGSKPVSGKVRDKDGGVRQYDGTVTVKNVAPTITSFTGTDTLVGPLAFGASIFTTEFTDPASADTWFADLSYSDNVLERVPVTGTGFVSGQEVKHKFTTAGCAKSATVTVTDDDGGVSNPKTATVDVGTGAFLPPLTDQPVADKLKNGQVLPVKVRITDCDGSSVTNLSPTITLNKGDLTTDVADNTTQTIQVSSVSAADSGNIMRSVDGSYIYNLRVSLPTSELNQPYTIMIYPYGTGTGKPTLRHKIVATK
jgi:hypothetical protein